MLLLRNERGKHMSVDISSTRIRGRDTTRVDSKNGFNSAEAWCSVDLRII